MSNWLEKYSWIVIGLIGVLAAIYRIAILATGAIQFNADEAVVGLMARHILRGEVPVFFWGQAYMGSLDAILVAAGFSVFGSQVWVIRMVQVLLYLAFLISAIVVAQRISGTWTAGYLTGLLLAVPPVNTVLYTTASLGGYGEALLFGMLSVLIAVSSANHRYASIKRKALGVFGIAFLTGLVLWANALGLVFCIPSFFYLIWMYFRSSGDKKAIIFLFVAAAVGFAAGSLPWWIFAAQHGATALTSELFGSAVSVEKTSFGLRTWGHLVNYILLGLPAAIGLRPPWNVDWVAVPLIPLIVFFWGRVLLFVAKLKKLPAKAGVRILAAAMLIFSAAFLFTSFGVDPSGRYFIVLFVALSVFAGLFLASTSQWVRVGLLVIVIGYQLWGSIRSISTPPGITTQFYAPTIIDHRADQELIQFLRSEGELRGYTTYWVAYPLIFNSQEEIIYVPRLPYHSDLRYAERDDRYAPYAEAVLQSDRIAYISAGNPNLDIELKKRLAELSVTWMEKTIGDYRVYYQLSRPVHPQEIGFGTNRE